MIPVTVLRSGGEYGPRHVQWLARQIPGLVCLSDRKVEGVETIPLRHDWPGWWAKMEMFSDVIDEDETKTNTRREGMYFGVNAFVTRFAIGMQAICMGVIFTLTGYNPRVLVQPDQFLASTCEELRIRHSVRRMVHLNGKCIVFPE